MALNYSVSMRVNPHDSKQPKKAYARAQVSAELSLKDLSKRIASQTTVSRADVSAVLISCVENTLEALRAGDQVDYGSLGKFRLQVLNRPADNTEVFTASNISGVRIQFIPGEELKDVFTGMSFNPVPTRAAVRAVLKAEKAGLTNVDISKKPTGSESPDEI